MRSPSTVEMAEEEQETLSFSEHLLATAQQHIIYLFDTLPEDWDQAKREIDHRVAFLKRRLKRQKARLTPAKKQQQKKVRMA